MVQVQQQQQPYPAAVPGQPTVTILYTAQGTPVQVANLNTDDGEYCQHYNSTAAKILGMLQITLGILLIASQIVVSVVRGQGYQGFVGFWASVIIILAGIAGVLSAGTKTRCRVTGTMILSIVAAVVSTGAIAQGATGAALSSYVNVCDFDDPNHFYDSDCVYSWSTKDRLAVAFHCVTAVLGLLEGIVAIVAAAICCHGCCCRSKPGLVLVSPGFIQHSQAAHHQYNPAGYYPLVNPTGVSDPYVSHSGAPAYPGGSTPPPEYTEKEQ